MSSSLIVEYLDEVEEGHLGLAATEEMLPKLVLDRGEPALDDGVVVAVAPVGSCSRSCHASQGDVGSLCWHTDCPDRSDARAPRPVGDVSVPWCITLDNSKGISRLRFWAKNRRVNGINDLLVFMHQGSRSPDLGRERGQGQGEEEAEVVTERIGRPAQPSRIRAESVVVYKVDRLTRSLSDFAKLVERLEAAGAVFVSVSESFNTATSMGRLTLHMLLSFAQFEREVTAERSRDKVAASKHKGLWMGGHVPLGYEQDGRTLRINEAEAETVQTLYALYRKHGTLRQVKAEADRLGLRTKQRLAADGTRTGGLPFRRGHLPSCAKTRSFRNRPQISSLDAVGIRAESRVFRAAGLTSDPWAGG